MKKTKKKETMHDRAWRIVRAARGHDAEGNGQCVSWLVHGYRMAQRDQRAKKGKR